MKQEDALSDLSNILGELKEMAVDMGHELNRCVVYSFIEQVFTLNANFFFLKLGWNLPLILGKIKLWIICMMILMA